MRRLIALIALSLLAACATPQQRCIAEATQDLRVVDRLIAETEATLARGYALEQERSSRLTWTTCTRRVPRHAPDGTRLPDEIVSYMCMENVPVTVTRPRAVDLDAERKKLATLKRKRTELARAAVAATAQCRATYPE